MKAIDIVRIGRSPTPAERGYQLAMENPDLLDKLAANLFYHCIDRHDLDTAARWKNLPADEKEWWRFSALSMVRAAVRSYPVETDPDPGPGTPTGLIKVDLIQEVA